MRHPQLAFMLYTFCISPTMVNVPGKYLNTNYVLLYMVCSMYYIAHTFSLSFSLSLSLSPSLPYSLSPLLPLSLFPSLPPLLLPSRSLSLTDCRTCLVVWCDGSVHCQCCYCVRGTSSDRGVWGRIQTVHEGSSRIHSRFQETVLEPVDA